MKICKGREGYETKFDLCFTQKLIYYFLEPEAFLEDFKGGWTMEPSQWTQALGSSEKWFMILYEDINRVFDGPPDYN